MLKNTNKRLIIIELKKRIIGSEIYDKIWYISTEYLIKFKIIKIRLKNIYVFGNIIKAIIL